MKTPPLPPLAPPLTAAPAGQEWWREGLHTWHARALQAEAEALRIELAAERRRSAELQARLQAACTSR